MRRRDVVVALACASCFAAACGSTEPARDVLALRVEPRNIGLVVGSSLQFRAVALRRDGSEQTLDPTAVAFSSSDMTRLQVSGAGLALALEGGTAFVVASYSDHGHPVRDSVEVVLTEQHVGMLDESLR